MKDLAKQTIDYYSQTFQAKPDYIYMSPGRINIIGEHVDYNDGYVLPAAIDKYVCFAISKLDGSKCVLVSKDLDDRLEFDLNDETKPVNKMWANYFLGVVAQIKHKGIGAFQLVFTSTIPIGAGLSSSAAVECGFAYALNDMFNLDISKKDLAFIGQKTEHTFVGVQCGIMDQFACVFGKKGHVIRLDCMTLEYDYHNVQFDDVSILLLDSNVKHEHLTSGYNDRRIEVEKGLEIVKQTFTEVRSFRDCKLSHLQQVKEKLGETIFKRCDFVVKEIARVLEAVTAIENKDFAQLGQLMFATHDGLSIDYEVSCAETDFLVDCVRDNAAVLGSRMMGGGFGGCTINLVKKGQEEQLIRRISEAYKSKFDIDLKTYKVAISDGTSRYE